MARPILKIVTIGLFLLGLAACNDQSEIHPGILSELKKLENDNLDSTERKRILDKAYQDLPHLHGDSLKKKVLLNISLEYLKSRDSIGFRTTNYEAQQIAIAMGDSTSLAKTYWDFSVFYLRYEAKDSAYYYFNKAKNIHSSLGNQRQAGLLLLNMAIIQKNIRDYTGSEVNTIKAISLLKLLEEYPYLYRAYNNLGILYQELEEYDKSLDYYLIAEEYLGKAGMENYHPLLWNNIGVMFKNSGQYDQAALYFNKALTYDLNLLEEDPYIYAMSLDNQAHNQFKSGDTQDLLPQFQKALAIRKKNNIIGGVVVSNLHLAEYSLFKNDTISAIQHASKAKELAIKAQAQRDVLAALSILSKADKKNSTEHLKSYIEISQKLHEKERNTRNKFARIQYETEGYIAQTEKLSERISFITVVSVGAVAIFILGIIIIRQNAKNKEMKLVQQKQEANRQVLDLIFEQRKKIEEGREKEKTRIARELHDGILGKLFGVRLNLDLMNEDTDPENGEKRSKYINEIQNIESEIRMLSHELSNTASINTDYVSILKEFVEQQKHQTNFLLEIETGLDFEKIEANTKLHLFRIIQESVRNIQKHAEATNATISLWQEKKHLHLVIEDNGKGFDHPPKKPGIGLKNIRERTKEMNGHLKMNSEPGKGLKIKINIPI